MQGASTHKLSNLSSRRSGTHTPTHTQVLRAYFRKQILAFHQQNANLQTSRHELIKHFYCLTHHFCLLQTYVYFLMNNSIRMTSFYTLARRARTFSRSHKKCPLGFVQRARWLISIEIKIWIIFFFFVYLRLRCRNVYSSIHHIHTYKGLVERNYIHIICTRLPELLHATDRPEWL